MPVTSVGTSAVNVVGASKNRISLTFRNDSTNDVYLGNTGSGLNSSSNYDYHLQAGDAINFNALEDGDLPTQAWYAIASGASSALTYLAGMK